MRNQRLIEKAMFLLIRAMSYTVLAFLVFMLGYIVMKGYSAISWEFITEMPPNEMTNGGIFPAILGTFYLMIGSALVSIPIGIITAIYLTEYASSPRARESDPPRREQPGRGALGGLRPLRPGPVRRLSRLRHLHHRGLTYARRCSTSR